MGSELTNPKDLHRSSAVISDCWATMARFSPYLTEEICCESDSIGVLWLAILLQLSYLAEGSHAADPVMGPHEASLLYITEF